MPTELVVACRCPTGGDYRATAAAPSRPPSSAAADLAVAAEQQGDDIAGMQPAERGEREGGVAGLNAVGAARDRDGGRGRRRGGGGLVGAGHGVRAYAQTVGAGVVDHVVPLHGVRGGGVAVAVHGLSARSKRWWT